MHAYGMPARRCTCTRAPAIAPQRPNPPPLRAAAAVPVQLASRRVSQDQAWPGCRRRLWRRPRPGPATPLVRHGAQYMCKRVPGMYRYVPCVCGGVVQVPMHATHTQQERQRLLFGVCVCGGGEGRVVAAGQVRNKDHAPPNWSMMYDNPDGTLLPPVISTAVTHAAASSAAAPPPPLLSTVVYASTCGATSSAAASAAASGHARWTGRAAATPRRTCTPSCGAPGTGGAAAAAARPRGRRMRPWAAA